MDIKKIRRSTPVPEIDVAGPAAWAEPHKPAGRPVRARRKNADTGSGGSGGNGKRGSGPGRSKSPRAPKAPKKRSLFGRILISLFWLGSGLAVCGLVGGLIGYNYLAQDLPSVDSLKNYAPPTVTYIYSDDGRVIGEYYHERRFVVPLEQIPQVVQDAFLAVEDADFYKHRGVNPKAIVRAALVNFSTGETSQGGSTITQQVVKTFLLSSEKSYTRKMKEMILALRLENNFSKEHILFLYLNQIYLGKGAYGVEAAARTYFAKSVGDLSLAEAAQLAGIIRAPNTHNPVNNPGLARGRLFDALGRMLDVGAITEEQNQAARAEVFNLQMEYPNPNTEVTPYFTEHVRRMMEERFGADSLYNDGWRIYTTVNIEDQRAADEAVARGLWEYARRRGYKGPEEELADDQAIEAFLAETARQLPDEGLLPNRLYRAVIMEANQKNSSLAVKVGPYPGHIAKKNLAWALKGNFNQTFKKGQVVRVRLSGEGEAGGKTEKQAPPAAEAILDSGPLVQDMILERRTDVQSALLSMDLANGDIKAMVGGRDFNESQFNRAVQSQRQPGSSFKPILYASAMANGFTPGSVMLDEPFVVDDPGSGRRWKPVNSDLKFRGPMTLYSALVSSRNLISIKILDRIGYEALAETVRNLGITEKLPESLTIALGAHGLHIPELLSAYSAFPNMGQRVVPRYITTIEDRYGNLVESFEPRRIESMDPGDACAVTWMLRGVVEQGTAGKVKPLGRPVAGKTGTTNDYSDAWFVGFTPELATAVWVGTDQQRPRAVGEVGGNVAGPIFLYYMQEALKDKPVTDFVVPPEGQLEPGGAAGICYRAGTVGTGISETAASLNPQDEFLRDDFEDSEGLGGPEGATAEGGFIFDRDDPGADFSTTYPPNRNNNYSRGTQDFGDYAPRRSGAGPVTTFQTGQTPSPAGQEQSGYDRSYDSFPEAEELGGGGD